MIYFELHSLFLEKCKQLNNQSEAKKAYKEFRETYQNKTVQELKFDSEKWLKIGTDHFFRIFIPPKTQKFILYMEFFEKESKVMLTEIYNNRHSRSF